MPQEIFLTGIANDDPRSRTSREFLFAQGDATGASNGRPICLIANKTSAGSETVETIGSQILNTADCYARFGRRSEMAKMYNSILSITPNPTIYGVAMAENGGAASSSIGWSFQTAADATSTLRIEWGGKRLEYVVASGDLATTTATGVVAKINADPGLPFSAATGTGSTTIASGSNSQALPQATINVASTTGFPTTGVIFIGTLNTYVTYTGLTGTTFTGCTGGTGTMLTGYTVTNASQVTLTASNKGPRGDYIINRIRLYFTVSIATTVTKGTLSVGSGADDVTLALAAIAQRGDLYYIVPACTATGGVTTSDGGVGQVCQDIRNQTAPSVGFDRQAVFGLDCAQSSATTVATSSAANAVRASFWHVHNNDYSPPMIAAIGAAVMWVKQQAYPAANFRGYTQTDTTNFPIPAPYTSSDRFTASEIIADLNNGVTPIDFSPLGAAVLNRAVTSYSVLPGTSSKDYRARNLGIPSAEDAAWEYLLGRWLAVRQDMVTGDPPAGMRPYKGFNTDGSLRTLAFSAIDILSSNRSPWGKPILDPGAIQKMKDSVYVEDRASGLGVSVDWEVARPDLQDDFQIKQGGPAL